MSFFHKPSYSSFIGLCFFLLQARVSFFPVIINQPFLICSFRNIKEPTFPYFWFIVDQVQASNSAGKKGWGGGGKGGFDIPGGGLYRVGGGVRRF